MATTTAIAVIGRPDPHNGGIEPQHFVFLTEGSRPALQLFKSRGDGLIPVATWIPTADNLIEDLVLMGGALTGAQTAVSEILTPLIEANPKRVEMRDLGDAHRTELYELSRKSPFRSKVVLTILEDSSLLQQAGRICRYQMNCELCLSTRADARSNREIAHA